MSRPSLKNQRAVRIRVNKSGPAIPLVYELRLGPDGKPWIGYYADLAELNFSIIPMPVNCVVINPPPADLRCEDCRRHVSELQSFQSTEDGVAPSRVSEPKLVKQFRETEARIVEAAWLCRDCY